MSPPISLRAAGVVSDGSDQTALINTVINSVNTGGVPTAIMWPQGQTGVTTLHPITTSQVWHVAESGSPGVCRVKQLGGTLFTWGTDAAVCDGGGLVNIAIDGNDDPAQPAIDVYNAARLMFDELEVFKVGFLAQLDGGTGRTCSQITFKRMHGYCSDVAAPLIVAGNGSGLRIINPDVMSVGASVARAFLAMTGSWDTMLLTNPLIQQFGSGIHIPNLQSGQVIQSIKCHGGFMDGCNFGGFYAILTGGTLYALEFVGVEVASPSQDCIVIAGTGAANDIRINGNRLQQAAADGIMISAPTTLLEISGNTVYGVGQKYPAAGIHIGSSTTGTRIANNVVDAGIVPGMPNYGLIMTGGDGCILVGNKFRGKSANVAISPALTNSIGRGNLGLADFG